MQFTALLHHVYNLETLRAAYFSLKREAAPGVDGETWRHYGEALEENLQGLSDRLKRGAYRAKPVRRVYIPKADGRQRPLGVTALEDKLVQRATVEVLNAIFETDFLGFSYGFRPGRSQHNALDAVYTGLLTRKVNWVLDMDIRGFFDSIDHGWLVKFVEHRIADRRVVVSVVQTFGDEARYHPHIHALCTRGGWNARGEWVPVPYLDARKAEELFRHRVLRLLKDKDLLSEGRIELLLSWQRSGFSIDDSVRIPAGEQRGLECVARYMLRAPVSLSRMRWTPGTQEVFYTSKGSDNNPEPTESINALEFVARVVAQIPEPRKHSAFYYGYYSNVARGLRKKSQSQDSPEKTSAQDTPQPEPVLTPARRAALRRRWAELIRRVYEVDPLICTRCGGQLRVISFITQPSVIRKIVEHLKKRGQKDRAPPRQAVAVPP